MSCTLRIRLLSGDGLLVYKESELFSIVDEMSPATRNGLLVESMHKAYV